MFCLISFVILSGFSLAAFFLETLLSDIMGEDGHLVTLPFIIYLFCTLDLWFSSGTLRHSELNADE